MIQVLKYLWAGPNTMLGLLVGGVSVLFGGRYQIERGCIEFWGGLVSWLLLRGPLGEGIMAMTMGHTVLGASQPALEFSRDHEHVHVRQYERWGPFFLPAYLGCSAYLWLKKKDPYRDNPFEVEAYGIAEIKDDGK